MRQILIEGRYHDRHPLSGGKREFSLSLPDPAPAAVLATDRRSRGRVA
jgi:hypothetical protein